MINKVLNWTFGACFRTIGRFLAIFIVGVLLIFIGSKIGIELPSWLALNVKASWVPGWAETLPAPTNIIYYECDGANSCPTTFSTYVDYFESSVTTRGFVTTDSSMIIGTNGYAIQYPTSTLKKDYIYNVNYYICANKAFSSTNYSIYSSGYQIFTNNNIYNSITRSSIGTEPVIDGGRTFNTCQFFSGLLVPEVDTTWVTFRIKKSDTTISSIYLSTISVEVKELGLYNSAIEDIIENSGFATAESVTEVQTAVNQVQEEVTELNNAQQETNDLITDDSTPDVSGMTDVAGYLPPGPLDSVLNLPLSILNSLNNKLNTSCTPLSIPLPFIDYNLAIPCISTIFSQIEGLEVFWESIGVILGAIIMYNYLINLYNWVDDVTSLKHNRARLFGAKSDADNWGDV